MPYEIRYQPWIPPEGRPWKIFNLDKQKIVGSSITEEMAKLAVRMRLRAEKGKK